MNYFTFTQGCNNKDVVIVILTIQYKLYTFSVFYLEYMQQSNVIFFRFGIFLYFVFALLFVVFQVLIYRLFVFSFAFFSCCLFVSILIENYRKI